jgi:competence protein ComEC
MPLACWGAGWFSGIVIQHALPEPQASLLSGILLGVEAGMPADVQEDFRVIGTPHIIAISG